MDSSLSPDLHVTCMQSNHHRQRVVTLQIDSKDLKEKILWKLDLHVLPPLTLVSLPAENITTIVDVTQLLESFGSLLSQFVSIPFIMIATFIKLLIG